MPVLSEKFHIRAYFDLGNGEEFSRTTGEFKHYPTQEEVLQVILKVKGFYELCKFKYAQVEKIYVLD